MNVVIIGGVAAGPKTASRIMRLNPGAKVTLVQREAFLSYAGCGLPYYVEDLVHEQEELISTPAGTIRNAAFFKKVKNFEVRDLTEATGIDREKKVVHARDLRSGETFELPYDKCVLATGASPVKPPIPGIDLEGIHTLHTIPDAEAVKTAVDAQQARHAVVVGGGLIGVEMAEGLTDRGCQVTVVEMLPQILLMLDWEMAKLAEQHMALKGVRVLTSARAEAFEADESNPQRVARVRTSSGDVDADLVIVAIGVRPNVELAKSAGLKLGTTGAISVDDRLRTSDPNVYAAGDCVEVIDRATGRPCFIPLGSTANKQGRVAANDICGVEDRFPGVTETAICKVFDYCAGTTGLTEKRSREGGHDVLTVIAPGPDKPHYYPTAKPLIMKLVADRKSGKLLGVQVTGPGDGSKRIDVAATAIAAGMTVHDVANLDLSYAPPFSSAMDNLITAANVARNKLDNLVGAVSPVELHEALERGEDIFLLDARSPQEFEQMRLKDAQLFPLGQLRERVGEVPKDRPVVAYCKVSLRGYEAALMLKAAGHPNVRFLDGGLLAWPYEKET